MDRGLLSRIAVARALSSEESWKILDLLMSKELDERGVSRALGAGTRSVKPTTFAASSNNSPSKSGLEETEMEASQNLQRICPLCGDPASYDDVADLYYCTHGCDQFIPWLPDRYTAMITGPPGAGKTPVLNAICDFYLRNGRPIIWLAFDDLPANLRVPLDSYCKGKLGEYESRGLATIVDCYSALAGTSSDEKYAMKNRADLNELSLLIAEIIDQKVKLGLPKILLDSTTPLFNYKDAQLVVQFLTSMGAKTKTRGGALLFSVTSGTIGDEISKMLETTADFVMELQFTEVE